MDFEFYISQFNHHLDNKEGEELAKLVTYQEPHHARSQRLMTEFKEHMVHQYVPPPWDELVVTHVKCCFMINNSMYLDAYKQQSACVQTMKGILQTLKDENWCLPVLYVMVRDLRLLSIAADQESEIEARSVQRNNFGHGGGGHVHKPNENLEKTADLLMGVFRVCATDIRSSIENSKRKGMMNIINQLFKIYFKINKLHLCKPLIRALENANIMGHFTLAQRVTYNYFLGMKSMFDSEYKKAADLLSFSFENCHPRSRKNKRLILVFLIPVKMLLGVMPSKELLQKYDVLQFESVVETVKRGDLKGFDDALEEHSDFFWKFGIYLILEKLRIIAYRNLFRKVCLVLKTHQVPISSLKQVLDFAQHEPITLEEVHCILANLIYEGKIKGYISLQHQKLVISKQNPFPPLSTPV